jgi:hypothetical protein
MNGRNSLHGLMAEFDHHETLVRATRQAYDHGYRQMDAYSPFPVEGLPEALGSHRTRVPWIMLLGGLTGAAGGYLLQYWTSVIDLPLNIGGRPHHSWPMFVIVTFELMVLTSAVFGVIGTLFLNKLPQPYHPVFNVPQFSRASTDRFFLCIEAADKKFDPGVTREFLQSLQALAIFEVEE